jgi:phenylalanyl-tRNA synthetase beta chain
VDFFDIKGAVEGLLKSFGLGDISFRGKQTMPGYDPEASCSIFLSESSIGHVGRISQEVLKGFQVDLKNAYAFEIDMEFLIQKVREPRRFRPFSRFPAVIRDISMVVEREVESAIVLGIIAREGGDLVESVSLFDLFHGKGMDPSEKAVAFRICYRSNDRTLDGKEVNQLTERIISRISQETGGRLREA